MEACTVDRLRLLLRDQGSPPTFTDLELDALIAETDSTEEAVALGWLLKAGSASTAGEGSVVTRQIGQIMTTYGRGATASESYSQALAMYRYWMQRAGMTAGNAARWMEIRPGTGTQVGNLMELYDRLETVYWSDDFSQLYYG